MLWYIEDATDDLDRAWISIHMMKDYKRTFSTMIRGNWFKHFFVKWIELSINVSIYIESNHSCSLVKC